MLNKPLDRTFQALSDGTRRAILLQLSKRSAAVTEVAKPHAMTLPAVMQHLRVLEDSGLVRSEKIGRSRHFHLEPKALRMAEAWLRDRRSVWESHFDRLGEFLDQTHPSPRGSRT
jgi:DNA-binding transcriptional ArsR family regulator